MLLTKACAEWKIPVVWVVVVLLVVVCGVVEMEYVVLELMNVLKVVGRLMSNDGNLEAYTITSRVVTPKKLMTVC